MDLRKTDTSEPSESNHTNDTLTEETVNHIGCSSLMPKWDPKKRSMSLLWERPTYCCSEVVCEPTWKGGCKALDTRPEAGPKNSLYPLKTHKEMHGTFLIEDI